MTPTVLATIERTSAASGVRLTFRYAVYNQIRADANEAPSNITDEATGNKIT